MKRSLRRAAALTIATSSIFWATTAFQASPALALTTSFTGATTQLGRVFRDAIAATCPSKAYPGIFNAATTYNYEVFDYHNAGGAVCVVFSFDPNSGPAPCGTNAHLSVYLGSYNPNSQATNFLGDVGSSITTTMAVEVPANTTAKLVVTNTASQANCSFTVSPTGGAPAAAGATRSGRAAVAIRNFMSRRADLVSGAQIDTTRFHRRLGASALANEGGRSTPSGVSFLEPSQSVPVGTANDVEGGAAGQAASRPTRRTGEGLSSAAFQGSSAPRSGLAEPDASGNVSFSTSLAELRAANAAVEAERERSLVGENQRLAFAPGKLAPSALDVWARGSITRFRADLGSLGGKQSGPSYIMHVGADYIVHPGLLVGVMAQLDWMEDNSPGMGTRVEGRGWMAGPYASIGLSRNIFLDLRGAWGTSDNEVNVDGAAYVNSFNTRRWLLSAKLTGHWNHGNLRISPNAEIISYKETQRAFTDQLGVQLAEQDVSLGRLIFGPDFAYKFTQYRDVSVELLLGIKGVWDFERDALLQANGLTAGTDKLRGKVEAGVGFNTTGGSSFSITGSYDGIGSDDYHAYTGRIVGRMPLTTR